MEIITRSCSSAKTRSSSPRAMPVGSFSLTISHSVPDGRRPASTARSTAASVWPGRRSTPPSLARSGTMWPGRARSDDVVSASASVRIVVARSEAEMPVVTPSRASTVTVYAVPRRSWLTRSIGGRSSRSASASVTATQM